MGHLGVWKLAAAALRFRDAPGMRRTPGTKKYGLQQSKLQQMGDPGPGVVPVSDRRSVGRPGPSTDPGSSSATP
eukprot:3314217-Rhodomonas_salina.1